MEKKLFYLLDSETNKIIPIEAMREEYQSQWKALCAKCKGSNQTMTINERLNIFHCHQCGWQGNLNNSRQSKQPENENKKKILEGIYKQNVSLKENSIPKTDKSKINDGAIFKNHWKNYQGLGFIPFPASKSYKGPVVSWKYEKTDEPLQPTPEDYQKWENEFADNNVWVLLGDYRIVLDPDGPQAEEFVQELNLPDCPISKSGGKSRHRFFRVSEPLDYIVVDFGDKDHLEVRTRDIGMIVPPSIHPETGRAYQWEPGHSLWEMPLPEFPLDAYKKIEALMPLPKMSKPCDDNGSVYGRFDVEKYLTEYGIEYKPKQRGDRGLYLLRQCLFTSEHGHGDKPGHGAIIQNLSSGKLGYKCFHNSCREKTWRDARQAISGDQPIFQFCEGYVPSSKEPNLASSTKEENGKNHNFNLIDVKNLLTMQEPDTEWLWEGVLPSGGLSLVIAKPKVGKTTFSFNLGIAVAQGFDFLGRRTRQGPVVYLALEEKKSEIIKELKKRDLDGILDESLFFHFGPAPVRAMEEVEPLIKETKAKLLVIDILQKFCRVKDLNDYAQVTRALEPLMATSRKLDCHTQFLHHAGKLEREDGDDILGSTALLGGVDTSIQIRKKPNETRRTFFTMQRYGENIPEMVIVLNEGKGLESIGSKEDVEIEETMQLILEALGTDILTEKEIGERVERRGLLISKALRKLVERGSINRSGEGKKGRPFLYEKASS